MIRSTQHTIRFSNATKKNNYSLFRDLYKKQAILYLDFLWNNKINYKTGSFDIRNNELSVPSMLSNPAIDSAINVDLGLSGRVKKACLTQVLGIIRSTTRKKLKAKLAYSKYPSDKTRIAYEKLELTKPDIKNINPELDSNCVDFEYTDGIFTGFIQLKCLGIPKIRIPVKFHRHNKKFTNWKLLNSFSLREKDISFRWEHETEYKETGDVIGADQGFKTLLTLSNGSATPQYNNHGKSLEQILRALSKCTKGSNRFKRKQKERDNFIGFLINKIDLNKIKTINLEEIVNIRYKKNTNRIMSHWSNPLIRDRLIRYCEMHEVRVIEQSSVYRSQRCSMCGLVMKKQRKQKQYSCRCGNYQDSDLNAAQNHAIVLPKIPYEFIREHRNIEGFYWLENGLYDLDGVEITVPLTNENM